MRARETGKDQGQCLNSNCWEFSVDSQKCGWNALRMKMEREDERQMTKGRQMLDIQFYESSANKMPSREV